MAKRIGGLGNSLRVMSGVLVVVGGFFGSHWAFGADQAKSRQNVLFIAVDDLKPTLGCYGDKVAITPSIDQIAESGTVFLNAQCQWPVCGPSRASLMTSLLPEAVGVTDLKTSMRAKNPNVLTLPQHFKNSGFTTAGVGKIYDPRCVDDKATLDAASWSIPFSKRFGGKSEFDGGKRFALAADVADDKLPDGQIRLEGIRLLRELGKSNEPFFLAVGFKKPHLPLVAPKKYWDLYQREQLRLAPHRGGIENASGFSIHDSSELRGYEGIPAEGEISDELQREIIHGYYACTSYVDSQIGMLVDELETLGLRESTTIVLWGDHGFHLGDHGMWGKHSTLEQAARVPLIVCPAKGTRTRESMSPVEFTDIFPTLCDATGVPIPSGLRGRSLMPIISGAAKKVRDGAITVFKSHGSMAYSYRTERHRYTEWINKYNKIAAVELFDYEKDPLETTNEINNVEYGELHEELARKLRADGKDCQRLQAASIDSDVSLWMPTPEVSTLATASAALTRLQEGNRRFIAGKSKHPHENRHWRAQLEGGQHPFAVVLGCSDSRVPPELLFDQGFGDLFVIRVAGNVVDTDVKASVEYAVHHLHTPLVLILGHTGCGAVTATVEHLKNPADQPKEVAALLSRIEPALRKVLDEGSRDQQISRSVKSNVKHAVRKLSSVGDLRHCIDAGEVRVVGAVYDMHTGKVNLVD